jgi:8-oxo-dGTP pyrophosphatase MutT (NUDIX family)
MQHTVRLLSLDSNKRMLLVQKASTGLWHWPGGKRKNHESKVSALIREVHEEVGLPVIAPVHFHTEILMDEVIYCYVGTVGRGQPNPKNEIAAVTRMPLSAIDTLPLTLTQKRLLQNIVVIKKFLL